MRAHTHTSLIPAVFLCVLYAQKHNLTTTYFLHTNLFSLSDSHTLRHTETVWLTISLHMENRTLKRVSSAHRQSSVPLSPYKVHTHTKIQSVPLDQWKDRLIDNQRLIAIKCPQMEAMMKRLRCSLNHPFPLTEWIIYMLIKITT